MKSRWVMLAILYIFRCGVWLKCNTALKGAGGHSSHIKAQANAWVINQSVNDFYGCTDWGSPNGVASPSEWALVPLSGGYSSSKRQPLSVQSYSKSINVKKLWEIWFFCLPALYVLINSCCMNSTQMLRFIPQGWWWDCLWLHPSSTALETIAWFKSVTRSPLHAGMSMAWFLFYLGSSDLSLKQALIFF